MTIYHTNDDGEITITYDSRWQFPELFGYTPKDPEYKLMRQWWKEATEEKEECVENTKDGQTIQHGA